MSSTFKRSGARALGVLGAALVIAAAAGGAYALANGGGTITACVHKKGGALYVAKKCAHKDSKLTWNRVGRTGPQGPKGTTGLLGHTGNTGGVGAVGPTFGAVSTGDDPPALTGSSVVDTTLSVNLPSAGPLWVQAHFDPDITCGTCTTVTYGIYVDGSPVHGSRRVLTPGVGALVESWGISAPLSAGSHTITLQYTPNGTLTSLTENVTVELGGILLGSG